MAFSSSKIIAFVLACFVWMGACIPLPNLFKAEEDFDELSLALGEVTTLRIDWRNGKIEVNSDIASTDITAKGTKFTWANTQNVAEAALDDISISLVLDAMDPTTATLLFEAPTYSLLTTYGADVEIILPAGVMLDITNVNGEISVEGNEGDTNVMLQNGNIDINSMGGNVEAINTNGLVNIKARPNDDGTVRGETGNGAVFIEVPADFGATVDLQVVVGSVEAAFDEFDLVDVQDESLLKVSAVLNGGGGEITGRATVGNVTLNALQ